MRYRPNQTMETPPVKEGDYILEIKQVEKDVAKSSGNDMLTIQLNIISTSNGEVVDNGPLVFDRLVPVDDPGDDQPLPMPLKHICAFLDATQYPVPANGDVDVLGPAFLRW